MSLKQLTLAWQAQGVTHTCKLVLLALADNANEDGDCWPSLSNIAKKCCLSRQGVLDQISILRDRELVAIDKKQGKSNRYKLSLPVNRVDQLDTQLVNRVDQSTVLTSQPHRLPLVNGVDYHQSTVLTTPVNRVDPNHKEPSIKPSREPSDEGVKFSEWFKTLLPAKLNLPANWKKQWALTYDEILRIDKKTKDEVKAVCKWARSDDFWSGQFFSPLKLRKRNRDGVTYFDCFQMKMNPQQKLPEPKFPSALEKYGNA